MYCCVSVLPRLQQALQQPVCHPVRQQLSVCGYDANDDSISRRMRGCVCVCVCEFCLFENLHSVQSYDVLRFVLYIILLSLFKTNVRVYAFFTVKHLQEAGSPVFTSLGVASAGIRSSKRRVIAARHRPARRRQLQTRAHA